MLKKILIPVFLLFCSAASFNLLSQNTRIDGYRGLWFASGEPYEYGYRFSGGVATFAARYRPNAVYSPEARKTFFVYGGTTNEGEQHLLIMVSYYDHRTHMLPKPVIVYDKMGVREPHDNASLSVDEKGYLWVFISGRSRTRPGFIFRSRTPYSIDTFDRILETEMLSPQPWWIEGQGFMLMFSKATRGRELYFAPSKDGKSWSAEGKLAGMGGHHQVSGVHGKKLVTVFNYHPGGDINKRTNLYLLQTDDMGDTWKTIDGKILKTPVTKPDDDCLIRNFEAEGKLVYINDLKFDSEGNPVILVVLSNDFRPGPQGDPREWMIIRRLDNKWNFTRICESTHNFDMGALVIDGTEWKIIGPTEPGPQKSGTGGEIALWISRDNGKTWAKDHNITSNSLRNHSFVRHPLGAHKDFYAFWTDGNTDEFSRSELYFTDKKCNNVWILPYDMKNEFEKPGLLKKN